MSPTVTNLLHVVDKAGMVKVKKDVDGNNPKLAGVFDDLEELSRDGRIRLFTSLDGSEMLLLSGDHIVPFSFLV